MNERIQELESQCWEPRQYGPAWFNSKKFALLIVRECADTIQTNKWAKDNQSWARGMLYSAELIKEHFGVEE